VCKNFVNAGDTDNIQLLVSVEYATINYGTLQSSTGKFNAAVSLENNIFFRP
jgi:hypothetical protein